MQAISILKAIPLVDYVAFRMREPIMFWGEPGVGKSQMVDKVCVIHSAYKLDVRLSQYDSVDMRGIPNVQNNLTTWNPPATLPFKGNPNFVENDTPIVLFLDEINSATQAVAAVAYQLINDRRVGEHELMDNVVVLAAGNREGDKGVTNRMPTPLANRFTHVEIKPDIESWSEWAASENLPPVGIAFLNFRKPLLSTFDPKSGEKAFATPRTWHKALKYYASDMPQSTKEIAISGAVGDGPAKEFWGFVDIWQKMIPMSQIEKDPKNTPVPEDAGMMYALSVAIGGTMDAKNVDAFHTYLKRFRDEFVVLSWQLALKRDEKLCMTKAFLDFSNVYRAAFSQW